MITLLDMTFDIPILPVCTCSGLGYTIEKDDEHGEIMTGCHACSIFSQEETIKKNEAQATYVRGPTGSYKDLESMKRLVKLLATYDSSI